MSGKAARKRYCDIHFAPIAPDAETFTVCKYCTDEFQKIRVLQTHIVILYPEYASLRPSEMVEKMWQKLRATK